MTTKLYLMLFAGAELARQAGIGIVLRSGWKLVRRLGWRLATLNEPVYIDERTLKDLGISRAQVEFELWRSPWRDPPY